MRSNVPALILLLLLSRPAPAPADDAPSAREVLRQADAAYETADWGGCADLYARAADLASRAARSNARYNAACCRALAGQPGEALAELERALEAGFRDAALLERDEDLASLRVDPRWDDLVARAEAAEQAYLGSINGELRDLFVEDQGDRRPADGGDIDWSVVAPRDEARRQRVHEILEAGELKAADDFYHAAMVLQHGEGPDDYETAHELCLRALEIEPDHPARWLAAASEDRWLMSLGKPQKYGTQFKTVDGVWTLWEVDPSVTDEERAEWNVPPLADARKRVERMNGAAAKDDEAAERDGAR